jgi:hypothetical protein
MDKSDSPKCTHEVGIDNEDYFDSLLRQPENFMLDFSDCVTKQ